MLTSSAPEPCPLTGERLGGDREPRLVRPSQSRLKNTPEAQPLAGLNKADVIFEEVVEGGITRFIAVFHCRSTRTVGPVRSARSTDPKVLIQLSDRPLLAYSGAASQVTHVLEEFGTASLTESSSPAAFTRDEAREIPITCSRTQPSSGRRAQSMRRMHRRRNRSSATATSRNPTGRCPEPRLVFPSRPPSGDGTRSRAAGCATS